ncbi:MAG: 4-(cytidine 5'-diphospho)-2-C-methyl-D-erythritol kinase [Rhizobiales bacterium]|nr:4-(cytidine 5'-diphospho)-2-C-methyl-D-erythritol kinase [Hyphomicrobiales bacterium]
MVSAPLLEDAPAKVNLTLRVAGRRADGFHDIESLVVFADLHDRLTFIPGDELGLSLSGPTAAATGPASDNLVLKAALALAREVRGLRTGRFILDKQLPVAAGLGGGSADAAAALRLLARTNALDTNDPRLMAAAAATGADIPICVDPRARLMRGRGDELSPALQLPRLSAVLANPGTMIATKDVFTAFDASAGYRQRLPAIELDDIPQDHEALLKFLTIHGNDLEPAAITLAPVVAEVLSDMRTLPGCELARMSGSGATCFGIFDESHTASAARTLKEKHPAWWVHATVLGSF